MAVVATDGRLSLDGRELLKTTESKDRKASRCFSSDPGGAEWRLDRTAAEAREAGWDEAERRSWFLGRRRWTPSLADSDSGLKPTQKLEEVLARLGLEYRLSSSR